MVEVKPIYNLQFTIDNLQLRIRHSDKAIEVYEKLNKLFIYMLRKYLKETEETFKNNILKNKRKKQQ